MARRYGLQVIAHLKIIDPDAHGEVAPAQLIESVEAVKKYRVKSLYAPPTFADSAAQAATAKTGATVLKLDDMGNSSIPGRRDYFEMMESNMETLIDGQWP